MAEIPPEGTPEFAAFVSKVAAARYPKLSAGDEASDDDLASMRTMAEKWIVAVKKALTDDG